eukprot:scaffold16447_cov116-Isochrysis_galbana.AAC.2
MLLERGGMRDWRTGRRRPMLAISAREAVLVLELLPSIAARAAATAARQCISACLACSGKVPWMPASQGIELSEPRLAAAKSPGLELAPGMPVTTRAQRNRGVIKAGRCVAHAVESHRPVGARARHRTGHQHAHWELDPAGCVGTISRPAERA